MTRQPLEAVANRFVRKRCTTDELEAVPSKLLGRHQLKT